MDSSIIRDIQTAYQDIYYPDRSLFEDIVNFGWIKENLSSSMMSGICRKQEENESLLKKKE